MAKTDSTGSTQVVMARTVAGRWIRRIAKAEYRVRIFTGSQGGIRNLPNLLRSFRDGKVAIKELPVIADLGVKEDFNALEVWSGDRESLIRLGQWAEAHGFETSGVW